MIVPDPSAPATDTPRLVSEINMTPFIDVMLVLLVIFMVATPLMMLTGVKLQLPRTQAAAVAPPAARPVVVSMNRMGAVFVGEQNVALADLAAHLAALVAADPGLVVHVRSDRDLPYGQVMDLLGRIGQGGVVRLLLVAE